MQALAADPEYCPALQTMHDSADDVDPTRYCPAAQLEQVMSDVSVHTFETLRPDEHDPHAMHVADPVAALY